MEKVLGIIAEYNPFHNGHLHHLNESKKIANCKYSVCVMGGNFTQRGSCSLVDKWSKAKMAILNGVIWLLNCLFYILFLVLRILLMVLLKFWIL